MSTFRTLLVGAALAWTAAVHAFPTKPVRIVVGFPAGGPLDQHARLLTDKLQAVLGQPVVVDYKAGAGGTVGAQDVMKAPPDGHTLMLANTGCDGDQPGVVQPPAVRHASRISRRLHAPRCSRWPCW